MSKKSVLKCICYATVLASLQVGLSTVAADDTAIAPDTDSQAELTASLSQPPVAETPVTEEAPVAQGTPATEAPVVSADVATANTEKSDAIGTANTDNTDTPTTTTAEVPTAEEAALPSSYQTKFDAYDDATMAKADWWNGNPFGAVWKPDQVKVEDGIMTLTIDKGTDGEAPVDYISGELRTQEFFGYGKYEVSMKAIKNPGTVSSFFTYTGPSDNNPWDEIDIEFLGKDTTKVQFNYYTDGVGGHEYIYDLGFDAAANFHSYGFDWQPDKITWFVDGKEVYSATENLPVTPGKIMMNAWVGTGVDDWLEPFDGTTPLVASYDWFTYSKASKVITADNSTTEPALEPTQIQTTRPATAEVPTITAAKPAAATPVATVAQAPAALASTSQDPVVEVPVEKGAVAALPRTGNSENRALPLLGILLALVGTMLTPFKKKQD